MPEFNSSRAFEHIRHLSLDIGSRLVGSEGESRAGEYIRTFFKDLNLTVQEQQFEMPTGTIKHYQLVITEPQIGEITSYPFLLTPDTPPEGLEGEIVFVEGMQEPALGPHLADKIVFWTLPELHDFFASYPKLTRYNPRAVILVYPGLGMDPKHLQVFDNVPSFYKVVPSFFIRWEDGLHLFKQKASKARLSLQTLRKNITTRNIIAELKGIQYPEEIIVIGGHYDSVSDIQGAMDNASGIGTVMELARIFAARGSKRTIRFVAWAAEEFGLIGSQHYLKDLIKRDHAEKDRVDFHKEVDKTEFDRHLLVISLDILGLTFAKDVCFTLGPSELTSAISVLVKELGYYCVVKNEFYGSDAENFAIEGIPSIALTSFSGPSSHYVHGVEDTMDNLDEAHIGRQGTLMEIFLDRYGSQAQTWPFERKVPEKMIQDVKDVFSTFDWAWHFSKE